MFLNKRSVYITPTVICLQLLLRSSHSDSHPFCLHSVIVPAGMRVESMPNSSVSKNKKGQSTSHHQSFASNFSSEVSHSDSPMPPWILSIGNSLATAACSNHPLTMVHITSLVRIVHLQFLFRSSHSDSPLFCLKGVSLCCGLFRSPNHHGTHHFPSKNHLSPTSVQK